MKSLLLTAALVALAAPAFAGATENITGCETVAVEGTNYTVRVDTACALSTDQPDGVFMFGNAIIVLAYAVLFRQALVLADIAKIEKSPVLELPGSHGYWAMGLGFALIAVVTLCQSVRVLLAGTDARFSIAYKEI